MLDHNDENVCTERDGFLLTLLFQRKSLPFLKELKNATSVLMVFGFSPEHPALGRLSKPLLTMLTNAGGYRLPGNTVGRVSSATFNRALYMQKSD